MSIFCTVGVANALLIGQLFCYVIFASAHTETTVLFALMLAFYYHNSLT